MSNKERVSKAIPIKEDVDDFFDIYGFDPEAEYQPNDRLFNDALNFYVAEQKIRYARLGIRFYGCT